LFEERHGARMRNILGLCFLVIFPLLATASPDSSSISPSGQAQASDAPYLPGDPSLPPAIMLHPQGKTPKIHKLTGSLVDATCMAVALHQVPSLDQMVDPEPLLQYYLQAMESLAHPSQGTGPGILHTQGQPQTPSQPTGSPVLNGEPETSEREMAMQAAQLWRADLMEHEAKLCSPNKPTSHFGILLSGGHLLRFDAAGDIKAIKALKTSDTEPGKAVKVKVAGVILEEEDTVSVASIEIKGQIRSYQGPFDIRSMRWPWSAQSWHPVLRPESRS
jgi:hypothetical protein